MIWFSFGLIFLALLGLSHGHRGKGKSYKKKDVEVLEVQGDVDWTDLILPVFNFGFGDDFRNLRRQGCTCQLTTPSPREICPGNATMNVTLGQHGWWQGKEMRRYKGRFRRHSNGRHHPKFKKAPLKSGCPMNVPTIPPPCPERLAVRRVRRHSPWKKGNGGSRYRKKDQSSSEEDGGIFGKIKRMGRKGPKTQPQKCVDPKTRETRIYYPGEKTPSYNTKYKPRPTMSTTWYSNRGGDREEEEDDDDNKTPDNSFEINTSPISWTDRTDIYFSRSSGASSWTSPQESFSISPSGVAGSSGSSGAASGSLDEVLKSEKRASSASWDGSQNSASSSQWSSRSDFTIQTSPSSSYSSGGSSSWQNSWSSRQGGLNDMLSPERRVPSVKWDGSQNSGSSSQWSSKNDFTIQPSPSSSYSSGGSSSWQNSWSSGQGGLNDVLNTERRWSSAESSRSDSSKSIEPSRTWSSSRGEGSSSSATGGSLDEVLRGGGGDWKSSMSASSASGWSGSSSSVVSNSQRGGNDDRINFEGMTNSRETVSSQSIVTKKMSVDDLARSNNSNRDDEDDEPATTMTTKSPEVGRTSSAPKSNDQSTWTQKDTPAPDIIFKNTQNLDQFTKRESENPVTQNIPVYIPKFDERNIWANTRPPSSSVDFKFSINLDQFTKKETDTPSTQDVFKYTPKFDERNLWALTKNNVPPETLAPFTLNQDLFTKRSSEAANTQNSVNVPKFDDRNLWPETRTTNYVNTVGNPNFNLMDIVNRQNEERERALRTTQTEPPTTSTSSTTTSTSTTTTSTSTTTTRMSTTTTTTRTTTTTTSPTTTSTVEATTTTISVTRREQISNENGRGGGINDFISDKKFEDSNSKSSPQTSTRESTKTDPTTAAAETTRLYTRRRGGHHNGDNEVTTKNSITDTAGSTRTDEPTKSNNANQAYTATTGNALIDEARGTKVPADNGVRNDKKSEGATTIAEIVTDGGRSTRNALDSQGSGSSARPDNRATDVQAIAKNGGPDEKNKSPLNDLLGGGSGGAAASNGKEMTFSDTGVTQARVNPPPAQDNFHKAGGGGEAPVRPPETINPVPDKQNGGGGSVNDFLAVKKDQQPTVLDDDVHRKYVFYLMFGSPNACPTCCNACSGAQPKVTINQITNSSGDAKDIKWMDTNTMSDGNGGSFYIGHRRGNQLASIQPMAEIKMTQEQKLCNTPFTAFFA